MIEPAETPTKPAVTETLSSSYGETSGSSAVEKPQEKTTTAAQTEQVIFTMGADGGEIVSVEKIDKNGLRGELSEEEFGRIASQDEIDEFADAIDTAFEAGMAEALEAGDDVAQDESRGEDPVLERLILLRLLGRRLGRAHALRRRIVRRLLLRRLIRRRVSRNRKERAASQPVPSVT